MDGEIDLAAFVRAVERFNEVFIRLPDVAQHSFTTLSVLHTLTRTGPVRLTALTATEQVTASAITQLVTRLERDGLVRRAPDPSDGRAILVHITPAGEAVVAARRAERTDRLAPLVDELSAEQRRALAAAVPALRRIAELGRGRASGATGDRRHARPDPPESAPTVAE
jgi:DNA-binding MarR family transcriptional regulator